MTGLTFSKFYPGDWRGGTLFQLTVEEEGMYIRSCAYMWDTGECIPGDDRHASRLLNVQIQRYQKLMGALIEKGKMTRGQGVIFNERVLEEISEFQRQSGHQSLRAKRGHETRKLTANAVKELMEEIEKLKLQLAQSAYQPPHQPPVAPGGGSLGGPPEVPPGVSDKKHNEIKEHEQTGQKSGTAEARSQKLEERISDIPLGISSPLFGEEGSSDDFDARSFNRNLVEQAFADYLALARRVGLTQVKPQSLKHYRDDMVRRMREHADNPRDMASMLGVWRQALKAIEISAFCQGHNDRGWKADLSYLCQKKSFLKLITGAHGNGAHAKPALRHQSHTTNYDAILSPEDAEMMRNARPAD